MSERTPRRHRCAFASLAAVASICLAGCFSVPPAPGGGDDDVPTDASVYDASEPDATPGTCGDSNTDSGEACDTGGNSVTCDSDCTVPACADGVFNPIAEQCDDGNAVDDGNGCDTLCRKSAVCSNSTVESFFEACDDGNQNNNDGCSGDCKAAVVSGLLPSSDRGIIDSNLSGTFDYMNNETSTGEAIYWSMQSLPGEEHRVAFEFAVAMLRPTAFIQSATFATTHCCLSGQATVEVHGYMANGTVELADAIQNNVVASFLAADESAHSHDVKAYLQTAADGQFTHVGLLLLPATHPEFGFNLGTYTKENADPNLRPKLSLAFCVDADNNAVCD